MISHWIPVKPLIYVKRATIQDLFIYESSDEDSPLGTPNHIKCNQSMIITLDASKTFDIFDKFKFTDD